ncbi:TIGR03768 family metallophosphoesterase [Methyloterricola oryzae]|uniref:TIGR03768 family metallophosphoesterase n=1 Tax=Methyloterricola oryzae TaxID=1495050 RepID=UPI0005EAF661|nr:TIGR03768 family metallophosphoesterase [Methyloterricola oryzae]
MCKFSLFGFAALLAIQFPAEVYGGKGPEPVVWPIAQYVFTTAEQQILPIGLTASTPQINPGDVSLYAPYGYSAWQAGNGLDYVKRTELAPGFTGAPNVARLLSFFTISDVHITDKESPAQAIYLGWSAPYGPASSGLQSGYSPVILSTTQVLDAAVQTINALHRRSPFDFGIALGDAVNNTQYNELRWYIDVLDGKVITPSSGGHAGAGTIDYQQPFRAFGLDKTIRWYQVVGNHDQFWSGKFYEDKKTRHAHVGNTVINMGDPPETADSTGVYMGVVDGSTPFGDIIKAGPEQAIAVPPRVIPDKKRHSLSTSASSSLNWMKEFFRTTSKPVGHGFTQANLDKDFASYSFKPKSKLPIKMIVLDDTCKGPGQTNYALGCLDKSRIRWLRRQLQKGQNEGHLMIIAAHVPINPQKTLATDSGNVPLLTTPSDASLLSMLHNYPNLILWIAGHRHVNVVTPQPYDPAIAGQGPQNSFWEVETSSLRDFPQQFRTFDIHRNGDNTLSIIVTNVDPAVAEGSPAAKSRGYAIGAARIFGATPVIIADTSSHAYNAELVKQLSPEMQAKIAHYGSP